MKMTTTLHSTRQGIADCTACPLSKQTCPIAGAGSERARLMFIGMEPGDHEELLGLPFVGPSGKYLESVLRIYGHSLSEFYRTNVVRCRPRHPNGRGRNATQAEVVACSPWTEKEIVGVDPDVIVLMGFTALPIAFPGMSAGEANGTVRALNVCGRVRVFVGCYHPAAILRQRSLTPKFAAAIRTALELE